MRLGEGKEEEAIKELSVLRIFFFPNRKTPIRGDFHFKFPVVGVLFHAIHIGKIWEERLCKLLFFCKKSFRVVAEIGEFRTILLCPTQKILGPHSSSTTPFPITVN